MANILHQRLDSRIERNATATPTNPGRTKVYISGRLLQNFTSSMPAHRFDVKHGIKSRKDALSVLDLWYVVNFGEDGPYDGFLFRHWGDYIATQENSACDPVSGSDFQLCRVHRFGGKEFHRPIYKPVEGVLIYRDRGGVISEAVASVSTTTGIATVEEHESGDTYTWAGQFDLPVTFTDSDWATTLETSPGDPLVILESIKLEEILL